MRDVGAVLARLSVRLRVLRHRRDERTRAAHEVPHQLVAELEALRLAGWRDVVFIVDDNFTGNRKQAMELLRAIERL
jgi:hypothetical protein